jgi:cell division protein YceG involved in septum cleavage
MKRKIIAGIILVVAAVAAFVATRFLKPAVANKQEKYFYIHTGENVETVKQNLVNEKFIKGDGFDFVARLLKYKTAKPGRYKLKDRASLLTLIRQLRSGDQSMVKLVIIKERTKELFAGKFGQQKKIDTEFDSLLMIRFLNNNDSLK